MWSRKHFPEGGWNVFREVKYWKIKKNKNKNKNKKIVESWSPQKASYPEKMFLSNILASVDAGKCVLSHIKNPHKSTFRKIYCDHLKIALFEVYSLVIFKENTAPAGVDSYAYLYFRIINAHFLARIHINASRERHKQYACPQTQGVNGYQLVITCHLSKGGARVTQSSVQG